MPARSASSLAFSLCDWTKEKLRLDCIEEKTNGVLQHNLLRREKKLGYYILQRSVHRLRIYPLTVAHRIAGSNRRDMSCFVRRGERRLFDKTLLT